MVKKKKTKVYLIFRNGQAYSLFFSARVPMNDDIMKFIENPRRLPLNYSIYFEGVKSRADVFIMLDFPPTPRSTKKYPTKRDVVRYLENLGLTYSEKDAIILEGEMDRVLGSILRNSQYTKWTVFDYEVDIDQSMILRKAGRVGRGQYHEFIRRLFHEGKD